MSNTNLESKETGRNPFKQEEVETIRAVVRTHLVAALSAYRDTFGEEAFDSIATAANHHPPTMKLAQPLTPNARHQVECHYTAFLGFDDKITAAQNAIRALQSQQNELEQERAELQAGEDTSRKAAEGITVVATQLGLVSRKLKATEQSLHALHVDEASWIRSASKLIREVCYPLLEQFQNELAEALKPFGQDAAMHARTLISWSDHSLGSNGIKRFLEQDRDIQFDHPSPVRSYNETPEGLREIRLRQTETLRRILAGEDLIARDGTPLFAQTARQRTRRLRTCPRCFPGSERSTLA